jgi:hypothetical protein
MTQKRQTPDLEAHLVGGAQGSGVYEAASFGNRLARYSKAGKRSRLVGSFLLKNSGHDGQGLYAHIPDAFKLGQKVSTCASVLCFRHYFKTVETVKKSIDYRLLGAITCYQHYLCEFCAIRRAAKMMAVYMERLKLLMDRDSELKPYILTLTVKNGHDLRERFSHLIKSKNKLRQYLKDNKKRGSSGSIFGLFIGGVCTVEITYSDNYGFHPHMHCLVLAHNKWEIEQFLQAKKEKTNLKDTFISQEWLDVTGDSFIVDITPIEKDAETGSFAGGCSEVFKYALKMNDLDMEKQIEAFFTLRGSRMVFAFGEFWGVKVPEKLTDDPLENEHEYEDLLFKWYECGYQHIKTITQEQQLKLWDPLTYDDVFNKKGA